MIRKKIAEIIRDACEDCKKQAILPEETDINPLSKFLGKKDMATIQQISHFY
jgi:hypothetical protein